MAQIDWGVEVGTLRLRDLLVFHIMRVDFAGCIKDGFGRASVVVVVFGVCCFLGFSLRLMAEGFWISEFSGS